MSLFEQISEHIWIMHADHETDRPILAAIAGTRKTLIMDAGNSPKHASLFKNYLINQGIRLPDMVVLTHWHWDHTFGLTAWDAPVIAHSETAKVLRYLSSMEWSEETLKDLSNEKIINEDTIVHIIKEYGDSRSIQIPEADIQFNAGLQIDLGGVSCEIQHVGGDHAADSCFFYVKEDKVLFLGDALSPSVYGGPRTYTSANFLEVLLVMYQYNAEIYVESHGKPTKREAFLEEISPWEQLARLIDHYGNNREHIVEDLKEYFKMDELSRDLDESIGYFISGLKM
ncbi:MBL fold metallo-hydrolase [Neobacillus sp. PS3-34]|uniref:MBL fold metallo-hydrolase n=1 Tax=Neobacillus sp. PS3-34 TaxID=3070678 RepID=UPI0027DFB04F|nr:MBL fold metallo-hydrolase [Neobacillus sp. PS3-34]WML47197.1 MBL fold metallo-hydrolase [Neobacillus sp. PS3-34]